jgi:hypothetical protein
MAVLALNAAPARSSEAATANDTARFLAGLPPSSNSPLAAYTKDPVWQQHARYFESMFAREESTQLSKVREFSNKYLTDKHDTMLYMFSGPDFLYASSFFPNASTYVLAGLEPVGEIPDLTSLGPWTMNEELRNLELSMSSLFNFSFFITHKMKTELHEGPVHGTLPVLYVFLARTGKTMHEVSLVSLDGQGNVQIVDELAATEPISMFANFYQPRMVEVFQSASPIEFGIGYRWRKNESNLLLAQKELTPTGNEEVSSYPPAEVGATGTVPPPPKKTRKRIETETRSLPCFPFCW